MTLLDKSNGNFASFFLSTAYVLFFGGFGNNYVGVLIGRQEYVYVGDYLLLLIWQQVSFLLDLKILFVFSWLLIC